jgi:hypothetical protein
MGPTTDDDLASSRSGNKRIDCCIREIDVNSAKTFLRLGYKAVEIDKVADIALEADSIFAEFRKRVVNRVLAATANNHSRSFSDKLTGSRKTNSTASVGDDSRFPSSFLIVLPSGFELVRVG